MYLPGSVSISNHSGLSIPPDQDLTGFTDTVIQLPRADSAHVLLLRERHTRGVDQLEVVGVEALSHGQISLDERAEPITLYLTDLLDLLGFSAAR